VVVDNASSDGLSTVVEAFRRQQPELTVELVREEQIGVSRAKNRGAAIARGEILIFLDADSRMDPSLIADVVAQDDAGHPAGCIRIVADSTDRLERFFFFLLHVGKVLFGVRAQMLYCERSLFLEVGGFSPELIHAEDLDLLQRLGRRLREGRCGSVAYVRNSAIATSTRRLRGGPLRRNLLATFLRMFLASLGIGRKWPY
jgi:glycosyltransferase involved in cell wall biosynthesis